MSAEILRRAANAARDEWAGETTGPFKNAARIHLAVAELLDAEADWGGCEGCGHTQQRCDEWAAQPDTIKCCPDCKHAPRALAVARAYLGEQA